MNLHGINTFTPFPRYENAIFVGDAAIETLTEMKIFGKALIGGELPNIQYFHPAEKLLECTSCVMHDQRVLTTAIRRGEIEYVLLENNPNSDINPADLASKLEDENIPFKVLDITSDPVENLRNGGKLFAEEKRSERAIKEYMRLADELTKQEVPLGQKILTLLAIRHPYDDRIFLFALSDASDVSKEIYPFFSAENPVKEENYKTVIPGLVEVHSLKDVISEDLSWIALTGDTLGCEIAFAQFLRMNSDKSQAFKEGKVFTVPYYGGALSARKPTILKYWLEAAEEAAR